MKICIIAEGCYPYVTGGVSSWVQMLVKSMPEVDFIIYTIGSDEKIKGKFVYDLPKNIVEIKEVFLESIEYEMPELGIDYKMSAEEKKALASVLIKGEVLWDEIFHIIIEKSKIKNISDLLTSRDFFDVVREAYGDKYTQTSFIDFFWNVRSMVAYLFYLIKLGVPKADIYHCTSTGYSGIVGSVAKYLYKKPFILTEHGIYTREREEDILKSGAVKDYFKDIWINYFYSLSKCAYDHADKVITLFNRNKEIEIEIGCSEEKIQIISNGVDVLSFSNIVRKMNYEKVKIGAIVRIAPIKDIKTMICAFELALEKINSIELYIMGPVDDQEYFKECKDFIKSNNIKNIVFTGKVDIKKEIGKMDFLLLTSISEGQPLAILEGMAAEKPFVTTDVGSCRELMEGSSEDLFGLAGIVCPVMDYVSISEAIVKLAVNKKLREEMSRNAYKRVSTIYTFDRFINSYKDLYGEYGVKFNGWNRL